MNVQSLSISSFNSDSDLENSEFSIESPVPGEGQQPLDNAAAFEQNEVYQPYIEGNIFNRGENQVNNDENSPPARNVYFVGEAEDGVIPTKVLTTCFKINNYFKSRVNEYSLRIHSDRKLLSNPEEYCIDQTVPLREVSHYYFSAKNTIPFTLSFVVTNINDHKEVFQRDYQIRSIEHLEIQGPISINLMPDDICTCCAIL